MQSPHLASIQSAEFVLSILARHSKSDGPAEAMSRKTNEPEPADANVCEPLVMALRCDSPLVSVEPRKDPFVTMTLAAKRPRLPYILKALPAAELPIVVVRSLFLADYQSPGAFSATNRPMAKSHSIVDDVRERTLADFWRA
uniref:Uncharacterized protein n=1 Tax=Plectus sambesii TaxID=2011161 RepID=A0A914UY73_9BILA